MEMRSCLTTFPVATFVTLDCPCKIGPTTTPTRTRATTTIKTIFFALIDYFLFCAPGKQVARIGQFRFVRQTIRRRGQLRSVVFPVPLWRSFGGERATLRPVFAYLLGFLMITGGCECESTLLYRRWNRSTIGFGNRSTTPLYEHLAAFSLWLGFSVFGDDRGSSHARAGYERRSTGRRRDQEPRDDGKARPAEAPAERQGEDRAEQGSEARVEGRVQEV